MTGSRRLRRLALRSGLVVTAGLVLTLYAFVSGHERPLQRVKRLRPVDRMKPEPKWKFEDLTDPNSRAPSCIRKGLFVVMVTSSPENRERRDSIRKTWCNLSAYQQPRGAWQCVFLIGRARDARTRARVREEERECGDLLLGSYLDSYRNLTLKVLHGFSWTYAACEPRFVLKTDDDCYVNVQLLHHLLLHHNRRGRRLYVGKVFLALEKRGVVRNKMNKWSVGRDQYPERYYPPYASGTGYLLSADLVRDMVELSSYIRPIPNEDAYVGILARHLGITPLTSMRFAIFSAGLAVCNYLYLLVVHNISPEEQRLLQANSLSAPEKCPNQEEITTWN